MLVLFHPHALERMAERGATEEEVRVTVEEGERFPAKFERVGFRRNFAYEASRHGTYYRVKQVEIYAVQVQEDEWLVITVIARYF